MRDMQIIFGEGKACVITLRETITEAICGVALKKYKRARKIGSIDKSLINKSLNEIAPDVELFFTTPESVRVLIDALTRIKESLENNRIIIKYSVRLGDILEKATTGFLELEEEKP